MSSSEDPIEFEIPIPSDRADQSITKEDVAAGFTGDFIKKIAEEKMPDLNCFTVESAMSMVAGSAKSAGYNVEGY